MAEPSAKKKILVVDDERGLVRIIRLNLEHDGFEVVPLFASTTSSLSARAS